MIKQNFKDRFGSLNILALLLVFSLSCFTLGLAQEVKDKEAKEVKRTSQMKEVVGEVTWIGKGRIAIVYNRNNEKGSEEEILLPFDQDVQMSHKKSFNEISVGDTVSVQYEEVTETGAEGSMSRRKAKVIRFVRAAAKKPAEGKTLSSE